MLKSKQYKPHQSTRYISYDNNKKLPKLYEKRENCCGCSACYAICPANAIIMEFDEEGFLYPIVDVSKCIGCFKCLSVCAFKSDQKIRGFI